MAGPLAFELGDLYIEGFGPMYEKVKGAAYKDMAHFCHGFQQPSGVWESFKPASAEGLLSAAFSCPFPLAKSPKLPPWLERAALFVVECGPGGFGHWLRGRELELGEIVSGAGAACAEEWGAWRRSQGRGVAAVTRHFRPSVIKALAADCGLAADGLIEFFRAGFPVVGVFEAPGVFPPRGDGEEGGPPSVDFFLAKGAAMWGDLGRFSAGLTEAERDSMWAACLVEVQKGWLEPPVPLSGFDKMGKVPVRRFPVEQEQKTRFCDNLKRSGANRCALSSAGLSLPCADTLAELATRLAGGMASGQSLPVGFWKSDHADAYKQIPVREDRADFCAVVAQGRKGEWFCFRPRAILFGSKLAVLAYNVVSRFAPRLFSLWARCPCVAFFDDFAGVAPAGLEAQALALFAKFNDAIGFRVKHEKSEHGPEISYLGLSLSAGPPAEIALPDNKREKYSEQIRSVLFSGKCSSAEADSLFGRLQWSDCVVFGKTNRAFLAPLCKRKRSPRRDISQELRSSMLWFLSFLSSPRKRLYQRVDPRVGLVVFSDASLTGLGALVTTPGGERAEFAAIVPPAFASALPGGTNAIYILGRLAALLAARVAASHFRKSPGVQFFLFVDNNASLSTLTRATAACPLAAAIARDLWATAVEFSVSPWLERVESAVNLADAPSRRLRADATMCDFWGLAPKNMFGDARIRRAACAISADAAAHLRVM
jgi:hypothetical protein